MGECPQHRFVERCAHMEDRFIYELRSFQQPEPVTWVVGVFGGRAVGTLVIPQAMDDHDLVRDKAWANAEVWLRDVLVPFKERKSNE